MSEQYPGGFITKSPVLPDGTTASGIWNLSQQAGYQAQGTWPPVYPPDAQFNYVTMLLHGDGTNGAQNNTFLDISTNNFTITRNGNTTQGSFSPYGSNWSNYLNGTSDWFSVASNAAFGMGTGDFTIESWVFPTSAWAAGGYNPIVFVSGTGLYFGQNNAGFGLRQSGTANIISYGTSPALNTWTHVAIARSGTTVTMYYNGVSVATATSSANFSSGTLQIGFDGSTLVPSMYLSNLRLVKGTAVYTSNFTPSTTPLTNVTGTSLLTCQSNRFIDNSSNAFAITVNNTPSVQRFNPFGTSTAYSTATIGGSGYFDGSGDSLACTGSLPATGDFTLSMWVYQTTLAGYVASVSQAGSGNTFYLFLGYASGAVGIQVGGSAYADYTTGVFKAGQWNYVQVVKSSSAYTVYVNGTALSVTGSAGNIGTTSIASGTLTLTYNTGAYISDVRIVQSALSNAVPTAPLTSVSGTTMLLNMTNAAIYDNAMMNDFETVGNAQISTSVKKYGTGSLAFDGTGDYLSTRSTPNLSFGTGAFTVEGWIYLNINNDYQGVFTTGLYPSSGQATLRVTNAGKLQWFWGDASLIMTGATTLSTSTWYHFAVSRSGTTTKIFLNGSQDATATDANSYSTATNTWVGYEDASGAYLNGYIDDLRITKGYARYTTTFTPPAAAFPNIGPV